MKGGESKRPELLYSRLSFMVSFTPFNFCLFGDNVM